MQFQCCGFSWIHWAVSNIDPNMGELLENASADGSLSEGVTSGRLACCLMRLGGQLTRLQAMWAARHLTWHIIIQLPCLRLIQSLICREVSF